MRIWIGAVDKAEKEDATRMIAEKCLVVVVELALIASATSSIHT